MSVDAGGQAGQQPAEAAPDFLSGAGTDVGTGAGQATGADFWPDCGWALLQADAQGWLQPTPAYFAAWLKRPELALVPESCRAEIALHDRLQREPLHPVSGADLAQIADADARDNLRHFITLREELLKAGSLQAWLLALWRGGNQHTPPLFVDLAVQAVLRGLLRDEPSAFVVRAAEMLFRPQRLSTHENRLLAGDRDTLDLQQQTQGFGELGRLLAQAQQPLKALQLQVLQPEQEAAFWREAARPGGRHGHLLDLTHQIKQELGHGLAFHLTAANSGLKALSTVLQRWVQHFLGVAVRITPLQQIDDEAWRWHIGLDAESSRLLDDLYQGHVVEPDRLQRLISLFRLDFEDPRQLHADLRQQGGAKPVYLGLAMNAEQVLRMKPQNLLLNLPLAGSN